jgi:hypothetical protein
MAVVFAQGALRLVVCGSLCRCKGVRHLAAFGLQWCAGLVLRAVKRRHGLRPVNTSSFENTLHGLTVKELVQYAANFAVNLPATTA